MNKIKNLIALNLIFFHSINILANDDPFEDLNRKIWTFNEFLDDNFAKPTAEIYRSVTPNFIEVGMTNFFRNVNELDNTANQLLQGKPGFAANDFGRFLINTSIGLLGFIDVASKMGLKRHDEDFGQTLGYWGVPQGPYLVLPFFGSSSFRDAPGLYADRQISPVEQLHNKEELALDALSVIDIRARLLRATKILDTAAKDKYIFIRESYLQKRESMINDGESEEDFEIDVIGVDY